ncbi:MAG: ABC transporter ATP-binding protein [Alphaproteobacteria bacterium]|nr:ABC transporter ATP-binding protein [Alphaproteobacteria bacterium]
MPTVASEHHLVVDGVTKTFGELRANDDVNLHVRRGSIHAILGENGAGKTTLMNILYGLYQPDEGRILVDDREVKIESPKDALAQGIGMVHQHFMLVRPLTVTENVILGMKQGRVGLDLKAHATRLSELSDSFGFEIDPNEAIWKLPMGMQQRVEILKLLYHNVDILIFDEPTSVLTPSETGPFFDVLRRLTEADKTILFITHKLEEVISISDRVTVMRNGQVTAEVETTDTDARELARLMIGRDVVFDIPHRDMEAGREMLRVENVRATGDRGIGALDDISLSVKSGEILGVAGVDGNGQAELAEVIAGLRKPESGHIRVGGELIDDVSVAERKRRWKIGYVPEDRHEVGLVLDQSVAMNLVLRTFRWLPFANHHVLNPGAIRANAEKLVDQYNVRLQSIEQETRYLSGGNQQKLILAREIEDGPQVLVVAQPTKGLDVGAIEFVQKTLLEQRARGVAILYISTELEHVLEVSGRIAVIFRGRITGLLDTAEATPERLGLLMAGAVGEAA